MNGALAPLTRSQNEYKELTTGNKISLSDTTKFIIPSRDIISQGNIKQSTKQQRNKTQKKTTDKKSILAKSYNYNHGLESLKRISILVCLTILVLPGQTSAAINCRLPQNLQHLCRRGPQLPTPSLSSIPKSNSEDGPVSTGQINFDLTRPLNRPDSSLSSIDKSPNDSKSSLSININGNKNQDIISTLFPLVHPVHRNNDEYKQNANNNNTKNLLNIKARIKDTEQSAQEKHTQGNFKIPRNVKSETNEKQRSLSRVSRSIAYPFSFSDWDFYFENPCRRFVFAPACRGVTSKRSHGPGIGGAPFVNPSAEPSLTLNSQPSLDDGVENIGIVEPYNDHELSDNKQHSQEDISLDEPEPSGLESSTYSKKKRSLPDVALDPSKRHDALDTFSSFYSPLAKKSDKNLLNSFSSFYSKRNFNDDKRANALDSFSSFYNPGKRSLNIQDNNPLFDSFSSFYAPSKRNENSAEKKYDNDLLDSFAAFYSPHDKRTNEMLDSFSSFYAPPSKRNDKLRINGKRIMDLDSFSSFYTKRNVGLDNSNKDILGSFSSFYAPTEKRNKDILNSFSSFYAPTKRNVGVEDSNKDMLGSFSSFYAPQKRRLDYGKRQDLLNSFSSFYAPSKKRSISNDLKRNDLLDSFSSFYAPSKRGIRDKKNLGSFSSFYAPFRKRRFIYRSPLDTVSLLQYPLSFSRNMPKRSPDVLDSFSSFYAPIKRSLRDVKRKDILRSFHSFYNPLK